MPRHTMADIIPQQFATHIEALLAQIEVFLKNNPHISPESFGWFSVGDPGLVGRLRAGGDVFTRKMTAIMAYLEKPHTERKQYERISKSGRKEAEDQKSSESEKREENPETETGS